MSDLFIKLFIFFDISNVNNQVFEIPKKAALYSENDTKFSIFD